MFTILSTIQCCCHMARKNVLKMFEGNLNLKMPFSKDLVNISPFIITFICRWTIYSLCTKIPVSFISSATCFGSFFLSYKSCRYGTLLGNLILMLLLFMHNIIKSVPSVHFLIFRLVYHFLHHIVSLSSYSAKSVKSGTYTPNISCFRLRLLCT